VSRAAVFVDAGYLFAQGSVELIGQKSPRSALTLDAAAARNFFRDLVQKVAPNTEFLRIYWYDGTSSGPTPQHLALMHLDDIKVRLGFVNSVGEQKGVDSLIVTDMIELARNRAIADALLLSGDEDLRVGVQQAQEFGVRVHIVGIRPARGSQSLFLLAEADTTRELSAAELTAFLKPNSSVLELDGRREDCRVAAAALAVDGLADVAEQVARMQPTQERQVSVELFRAQKKIPSSVDRELLTRARKALGGQDLDGHQKKTLRKAFIDALESLGDQTEPNTEVPNP